MNRPPGPAGPPGEMPPPKLTAELLAYFWHFVKPDTGKLVLITVGLMFHAGISVGMAAIPTIIDHYWNPNLKHTLLLVIAGLLAVNLIVLLLQLGISWLMTRISENVLRRVKLAIFEKIGSLPSEEMSFQSVGKFAQRTTGDVMRLGGLVTPGIPQLLLSTLQLVYMTIALFWLNWRFAWIFPLVLLVVWVVVRRINARLRYWARKDQLKHEDIMTHFIEAIGGCRDLVASGRFQNYAQAYNKELVAKQSYTQSAAVWNSLSGLIPMGAFSALAFAYYLFKINAADMTAGQGKVGDILSYAAMLTMAQGPILVLFHLFTDAELSAPSLYELRNLLSAPEVKDPPFSKSIGKPEIVFDHVTFIYGMGGQSNGMGPPPTEASASRQPGPANATQDQGPPDSFGAPPPSLEAREMKGPPTGMGEGRRRDMGPPKGMREMGPPLKAGAPREMGPPPGMNGPESFGPRPIVNNVNIRIAPGTFAAIVGQSGSGKTTLFYLLLRLLEPVEGDVRRGRV